MKKVGIVCAILLLATGSYGAKVTFGGGLLHDLVYVNNGDFNSDTNDQDVFSYVEADITVNADLGEGVNIFARYRAWGFYDFQFTAGAGEYMESQEIPRLYESYLKIRNFLDLPWDFTIGRQFWMYGDGLLIFDTGQFGLNGLRCNIHPSDALSFDLFAIRQNQTFGYEGSGYDQDIFGAYGWLKFANMSLEPYFMHKEDVGSYPSWFGARLAGSPAPTFAIKGEFAKMMGKGGGADFDGMAAMAEVNYQTDIFGAGAGYWLFSGDDTSTTENEQWSNALGAGNYVFDNFFNGWIGFGEFMTWGMYNPVLRPGGTFGRGEEFNIFWLNPTNLNVINAHLYYQLTEALRARVDFFNFGKNWVSEGEKKAIGNEIDLTLKYNWKNVVTLGLAFGIFLPPGDLAKDVTGGEDMATSARFWVYKTFGGG
jgi:hypothetical protein